MKPQFANLKFSDALEALDGGRKIAREGWNGKGMYLFKVQAGEVKFKYRERKPANTAWYGCGYDAHAATTEGVHDVHTVMYDAHVVMYTAQGTYVPWLASQTDLLAADWCVL